MGKKSKSSASGKATSKSSTTPKGDRGSSKKKKKRTAGSASSSGSSRKGESEFTSRAVLEDPRFNFSTYDERFQKLPSSQSKVKIDKRFEGMFKDDEFKRAYKFDKYGRKINADTELSMEAFYDVESDDEGERKPARKAKTDSAAAAELPEVDPVIYTGYASSSSDESYHSSDEEVELPQDKVDDQQDDLQLEQESIPTGEESSRLAVQNLDWQKVHAVDILAILNSFCPPTGLIRSVEIFPSLYGLEMMQKERESGPGDLWKDQDDTSAKLDNVNDDDDDDEDSDNEDEEDDEEEEEPATTATDDRQIDVSVLEEDGEGEFDSYKLRNYEKNKLRYYFAVATCDSVATASAIYDACDGVEFQRSGNVLDLRFIPEEMEITHAEPKETADSVPASYRPPEFETRALRHSRVELTWDKTDEKRLEVTSRRFTKDELREQDFAEYLASPSDSEGEGGDGEGGQGAGEQMRNKLLGLLSEIKEKERQEDDEEEMHISFVGGLREKAEKLVAAKKRTEAEADAGEESVFEARRRKKKEARKEKRRLAKLQEEEREKDEDGAGYSDDEDDMFPDDVMDDPFFAEEIARRKEDEAKRARDKRLQQGGERDDKKSKKGKKGKKGRKSEEEEAQEARERAELELLMMDENDEDETSREGYKLRDLLEEQREAEGKGRGKKKGKKGKGKGDEEDSRSRKRSAPIDVQDARFNELFSNADFAIDPTDPRYKRTPGMLSLQEERSRRRQKLVAEGKDFATSSDRSEADASGTSARDMAAKLKRKLSKKKGGAGGKKRQRVG